MDGCSAAKVAIRFAVESVERSSSTRISQTADVPATLAACAASVWSIVASSLRAGIRIETVGREDGVAGRRRGKVTLLRAARVSMAASASSASPKYTLTPASTAPP